MLRAEGLFKEHWKFIDASIYGILDIIKKVKSKMKKKNPSATFVLIDEVDVFANQDYAQLVKALMMATDHSIKVCCLSGTPFSS